MVARMRLGAHLSIAGGLHKAVQRAAGLGCDTLQVFLSNPRGWNVAPLGTADVQAFLDARQAHRITPVVAHMPYLPNVGSTDPDIYRKSVDSLSQTLDLCDQCGIEFLVMHLGKSKDSPVEEAIARMVAAIDRTYLASERKVILCLENTAGQGTEIGQDFETLGCILNATADPSRLALCLDTCHAFAAGHDLRTRKGLDAVLRDIDRHIGLERLRVLHLNDSLKELGSRRDRHAHIGEGFLGRTAFGAIVNHPRLRHLPGLLETPYEDETELARDLAVLRQLQR